MERVWHDGLTRWQQAFFLLLRYGLWEQSPGDTSPFPLTDDEWMQVYTESQRQTVQGLLFRGFQQLPESLFPPQSLVMRWLADTTAAERSYRQSVEATAFTWKLFSKAGLNPMLQKGLAVGMLYEHPEERVYGDVDWCVDDMAAAEALLHKAGIKTEHRADQSLCFACHGTEIEVHPQLISLQNPSHRYALDLLLHDGEHVTMTLADGSVVSVPTPLQTIVLLQTHIMRHVVTSGIGLRQFCDLARAYHTLHRRMDDSQLVEYFCRLGLLRWTQLTHTFLHRYLGIQAEELPCVPDASASDCLRLARAILRWGNFGRSTMSWFTSFQKNHTKLHTATRIARNLPFALRYAPAETAHNIKNLIVHQRDTGLKKSQTYISPIKKTNEKQR